MMRLIKESTKSKQQNKLTKLREGDIVHFEIRADIGFVFMMVMRKSLGNFGRYHEELQFGSNVVDDNKFLLHTKRPDISVTEYIFIIEAVTGFSLTPDENFSGCSENHIFYKVTKE